MAHQADMLIREREATRQRLSVRVSKTAVSFMNQNRRYQPRQSRSFLLSSLRWRSAALRGGELPHSFGSLPCPVAAHGKQEAQIVPEQAELRSSAEHTTLVVDTLHQELLVVIESSAMRLV